LFVGTAEVKQSGVGYGGTFGVHYRPIDSVNIAVTVESGQKISQDLKETSGNNPATEGFLEGYVATANTNADRPWRMRIGASYGFDFGLEIPVSFKYDFYKAMDSSLRNSYSIAMALRYRMLDDALELSFGTSYDIDEVPSVEDYNPLNPELASVTIAGGVGWEIFEDFKLDIGVLYPFYFDEAASGANGFTKMSKQVVNLALGVGYVFN
jgi:long-subunit fatty acid transport protein